MFVIWAMLLIPRESQKALDQLNFFITGKYRIHGYSL